MLATPASHAPFTPAPQVEKWTTDTFLKSPLVCKYLYVRYCTLQHPRYCTYEYPRYLRPTHTRFVFYKSNLSVRRGVWGDGGPKTSLVQSWGLMQLFLITPMTINTEWPFRDFLALRLLKRCDSWEHHAQKSQWPYQKELHVIAIAIFTMFCFLGITNTPQCSEYFKMLTLSHSGDFFLILTIKHSVNFKMPRVLHCSGYSKALWKPCDVLHFWT